MKLSADFSARNLSLILEKQVEGFNFADLTLNQNFKSRVLDVFPGGAWLSIGSKRLKTSSQSNILFIGEALTLVAKSSTKGIELRIVDRELKSKEDIPYKLESMGMSVQELSEKVVDSNFQEFSTENSIFKVLKSYYPFLEWASDLPYFRWEFDGGNAEGIYESKKESKKFLFRIQTKNTGRTIVLFLWKENSGEDLQINLAFDNLKMYLHACQNKEKFKQILAESLVSFQGYNLSYKPSLTRKEWNA
ncbi:hypothetical protein [Leptospira kirschneri]|uniref:Uncharacterized protein n=1 Tax=Leptospira kirschneri str. 200802841 TaxID=1193047 RepID=A0A828YA14_9LEPT|nr:hypothetical protein [Leptospira kirschneri]EMO74149.1 hypothetical protein LEP1GSC127_2452 [Leptospira kirschneri str. 200801925]EJO70890.1 hypothetical protein LEP1GSC044_2073 [Leptospira kirschneri serovar Grippotyphosa str. RM52]EKO52726.1 hypothetical protein LEP1GSC131_2559 [Leptospira kirschneri str. 200802841]EKQ84220.1 hypothetical protein LEP1GSC064_0414 [Leptospira kirschneri serovar Grippotyphosa str. Moskva]EKR10137.1 hypothetical protein LEP1GSC122_3439 [Leptospira kirschneri 